MDLTVIVESVFSKRQIDNTLHVFEDNEFIPEQFTEKAHPALFERDGEGQTKEEKSEEYLSSAFRYTHSTSFL